MKKLTKPKLSPFYLSSIFNFYEDDNGFQFFNILKRLNLNIDNLEDREIFTPYLIKPGDSYTKLAKDQYGYIDLWWLICLVNKIDNPFIKPVAGSRIFLLNKSYAVRVLDAINTNNA